MNKSQAIKTIDKAYSRLSGCCEHTNEWDRYVDLIEEEEKGHRKFKPAGIDCGLTKAQSVRLFVVKEVFERFVPAHKDDGARIFTPEAKDYFSIRGSVFGACAIADRCGTKILKEFCEPEMVEWLASIDYAQLNRA